MKLNVKAVFKQVVLYLIAVLMVLSTVNIAYAIPGEDIEYALNYGSYQNSDTMIKEIENTNLLHYNSIMSELYDIGEYQGHHFSYSLDCSDITPRLSWLGIVESPKEVNIEGIIGIPEKVEHDELLIFLHGRMDAKPGTEYGFSYLVDYAASNGYVAISLNLCDIYFADRDEVSLMQKVVNDLVNKVNKSSLKESITDDKINTPKFKEISLVGHSRSGYHVFTVGKSLVANGYTVNKIISIAPAIIVKEMEEFANIPSVIILPEYDGDVHTLDGQCILDNLVANKNCETTLYYLFGGNHNYFNTAMVFDDSVSVRIDTDKDYGLLPRESHMQFMMGVLTKHIFNSDLAGDELLSDTNFLIKNYTSEFESLSLLNVKDKVNGGVKIGLKSSTIYGRNSLTYFREPWYSEGYNYNYYILSPGGNVEFNLDKVSTNKIAFEMALDSTVYLRNWLEYYSSSKLDTLILDKLGKFRSDDIHYTIEVDTTNVDTYEFEYIPTIINGWVDDLGATQARFSTWTPIELYTIEFSQEVEIKSITIMSSDISNLVLKRVYIGVNEEE